ncbi:flagellar basal body and hook protein [Nautilia profundicola AmH]|uniref:Flagellar basal body and hook protein n=1 Tax=Nautilia profundicola (strain ATCC BAA-1463 / DSM 18972 / AmH) TaxID=598659 RepID=B9L650_NAUPA|nr:flagellar hook-basal body complex protein [Nautilia profundicola]ACM93591.1 flagellar basal body and hook protein [Nautilia profundicola AmH]
MTTSFYNGITGLKSFQYGIDIWGDNIANINTTGYKEQIPEFSTLFSETLNSDPVYSDIGMGSKLSSTAINLDQGSLINTDNPFDVSINGEGWLAVKRYNDTYYTRTGSFTRDAQGYLVDDNGDYLLVANANNLIQNADGSYSVNRSINTDNLISQNTQMSPISLPNNVILPAIATTEATLTSNLNDSDVITTTKPSTTESDFSALYSKDGADLKVRDGDSLVFGFGNPATYQNNIISTELCITDDEADGKDAVYNFTLNGINFNIDMPDGSTKEEIQHALKDAFDQAGIINEITDNGIKISDPNHIILTSENELLPNIAAAKLTYRSEPQNSYEFSTIQDFDNIIQNLANSAYPDATNVYLDDEGRISIDNNSFKTINAYTLNTENSNDLFMNNLGRLGNEIYAGTSAKSYDFLTNTQSFGGKIIEANGQKDTISVTFTKQKVLNNQIVWNGEVSILDPDSNEISTQNFEMTFDSDGHLLSPTQITISSPQNITLNFNMTSYAKTDLATSYSFTQNGVEEGFLKNYQIDQNGQIQALFSNGQMSVLGQIPVYHFQNDQGLESLGGNLFRETANSNKAILYTDQNGNYISGSSIISNTLEASNVDFSQAMTELIVTQKAYSSAAKTVTTSDQMIQRAIDMKKG